jgi:hypothetical protein
MRRLVLSLFMIAAALLGEARAASPRSPAAYPWCIKYEPAAHSCYFTTREQCKATGAGIGGLCYESVYVKNRVKR